MVMLCLALYLGLILILMLDVHRTWHQWRRSLDRDEPDRVE